jgi:hypothetical protein
MTGAAETVVHSFWNQERAMRASELTTLGGNGPVKDRVATRRLAIGHMRQERNEGYSIGTP